ncbi:Domain of unknown function DUF4214 [Rhabdaerophilaceae bacterium]
MATFTGTSGNDVANSGNSTLTGFSGATLNELRDGIGDVFNGEGGDDTIYSASGNDRLNGGSGDDFLAGRGGNDTFDGGEGYDEVRYDLDAVAGGSARVIVDLATGVATDGFGQTDSFVANTVEAVRGTAQADVITGSNRTDEAEQFSGLAGNDTINGQGGNDEVRYDRDAANGGAGAVIVNLAAGFATDGFGNTDTLQNVEFIRGTAQGDTFIGSDFDNIFSGLGGADTFNGGGGFDTLRYDRDDNVGGLGAISVNFTEAGVGTVVDGFGTIDSFSNIEAIRGTVLPDTFVGSSVGSEFFAGLGGNDTLNGGSGPGTDWARYDRDADFGGLAGITANLATGFATDGFGNTDTLIDIEGLRGTSTNDSLIGSSANNGFQPLGGNDTVDGGAGTDESSYSGNRSGYQITKSGSSYQILDNTANRDGTDTLSNVEIARFSDMSVNFTVAAAAAGVPAAQLKTLLELYVGFFNRIPEAAGVKYWIDQLAGNGGNLTSIANQFYEAGVQFSSLTGYSATMTNAEFITKVYANVLGRSGSTAPNASEIAYWNDRLVAGTDSKGSMVLTMISDTHRVFTGDPTFGFVASLLTNKSTVANIFAIQQGISYNTDAENITRGMELAAAVTPTSTAAAIALIGVTDVFV